MPRISFFFFGITIAMFWDERDHPVPHFHAEYAGRIAAIDLDGTVLAGSLSRRQLRLVREWAEQHHEELSPTGNERAGMSRSNESNRSHKIATWIRYRPSCTSPASP
jgi:Domain of unknown function (DUF4160)